MFQQTELSASRELLHRVDALRVPYGRETSFKLLAGRVLGDRALVGIQRADLDVRAFQELVQTLAMPENGQQLLTRCFAEANAVFLAVEQDGPRRLFKAYVEFWDRVRARVRAGDTSPQLLHLGVKWSSAHPGHHEQAHYACHPLLGVRDVLRRMRAIHPPDAPDEALRIAQDLVRLGVKRRPDASFLYLEASEAGNARRSFDVNFYKTGLRVADASAHLHRAARHFGVGEDAMESALHGLQQLPLGHVAGGTNRHGAEFLSVYAEVAPLPEPAGAGWSER